MPAPRADRPRDAELAPPLRGEHDEDEEDEEDPGGDREGAERREEGHEGVALEVRGLDRVLLRLVDVQAEGAEHGLERLHDFVAQPGARPLVPAVGEEDVARA